MHQDTRDAPHDPFASLLTAVAARDRTAFRTLYEQTRGPLRRVALRILGDVSLAEDALQDSYVSVWEMAGQFDPARGAALPWMRAIVRNRSIDLIRRVQQTNAVRSPASVEAIAEPGGEEDLREAAVWPVTDGQRLERAMSALYGPYRQVLSLAYGRDLSHEGIARHLGVPLGTVKTWIRRGLEALRAALSAGAPETLGA